VLCLSGLAVFVRPLHTKSIVTNFILIVKENILTVCVLFSENAAFSQKE